MCITMSTVRCRPSAPCLASGSGPPPSPGLARQHEGWWRPQHVAGPPASAHEAEAAGPPGRQVGGQPPRHVSTRAGTDQRLWWLTRSGRESKLLRCLWRWHRVSGFSRAVRSLRTRATARRALRTWREVRARRVGLHAMGFTELATVEGLEAVTPSCMFFDMPAGGVMASQRACYQPGHPLPRGALHPAQGGAGTPSTTRPATGMNERCPCVCL